MGTGRRGSSHARQGSGWGPAREQHHQKPNTRMQFSSSRSFFIGREPRFCPELWLLFRCMQTADAGSVISITASETLVACQLCSQQEGAAASGYFASQLSLGQRDLEMCVSMHRTALEKWACSLARSMASWPVLVCHLVIRCGMKILVSSLLL